MKLDLMKNIAGIPTWGWGLIILIGGVGAYFITKHNAPPPSASNAANSTPPADGLNPTYPTTGYSVDAHGNVVDANGNIISASQSPYPTIPQGQVPVLPPGMCPNYDASGNVISFSPCAPTPTPPPTQQPTTKTAVVRSRDVQGPTKGYDQRFPQGVPLRATPGGKQVGFAPYGSPIQISPTPVTGLGNFSAQGGNFTWFKTAQGTYISAYDLQGGTYS